MTQSRHVTLQTVVWSDQRAVVLSMFLTISPWKLAKYIKTDLGNALPKLRPFSKEKYTAERDKMCIGEMKVASKESGICCANVLYSRRNGSRCCLNFKLRQGITYSQRKQICCEGEILDKERFKDGLNMIAFNKFKTEHMIYWISSVKSQGIDEENFLLVFLNPKSVNGDVVREWSTKKQRIIAALDENWCQEKVLRDAVLMLFHKEPFIIRRDFNYILSLTHYYWVIIEEWQLEISKLGNGSMLWWYYYQDWHWVLLRRCSDADNEQKSLLCSTRKIS